MSKDEIEKLTEYVYAMELQNMNRLNEDEMFEAGIKEGIIYTLPFLQSENKDLIKEVETLLKANELLKKQCNNTLKVQKTLSKQLEESKKDNCFDKDDLEHVFNYFDSFDSFETQYNEYIAPI